MTEGSWNAAVAGEFGVPVIMVAGDDTAVNEVKALIGNAEGPPTLLERMYIGYSFTPLGSVIGALWGFVDFAIGGAIAAWLYQKIKK